MEIDSGPPRDPRSPRELQVEVTGACNLRCRMCLVRYRPPLNRAEGSLSFAIFQRLIDTLPGLERVTLQGLGEPLLAPDLVAMIEYAAARGIRTGFNTNATLLTRERAERLIRAGLGWLHISLDGATPETYESIRDGASFAEVCANVRGLVDVRRALGAAHPDLCLVFVAMRRNVHELPALVRLAAGWDIPSLRVQNLSHSFSDTGASPGYAAIERFTAGQALWQSAGDAGDRRARAAFEQARVVAAELGVALRLPALEEPAAPRRLGTPGCDWPWRSAYVTHRGKIQPCCMLMGEDRAVLGDLGASDFGSIWRGEAYRAFRAGLCSSDPPDVCRGCSMYRGVF
jgi:radical SAM protein with 4Fe4S-binding SPASM domain